MTNRPAYAVTHDDPPQVYLAEDADVLNRVLALKLVAATTPSQLDATSVDVIRDALLEERWADALVAWMEETGTVVDVYPSDTVWTDHLLDEERTVLELRMAPIFSDDDDAG